MAEESVLTPTRNNFECEHCGEEILNDAARVDGGHIFHLSCFGASVGGGRHKLQVCPGCYTLGARWNQDSSDWEECQACEGAGYLSKNPSRE